jgi:predicted aldo/keto reductase-like oxidoreductase
MRKNLWFNMEHIFSKSLRIANVSKLGMYLVHYLKENTYETANACVSKISYNEDFINRECLQ